VVLFCKTSSQADNFIKIVAAMITALIDHAIGNKFQVYAVKFKAGMTSFTGKARPFSANCIPLIQEFSD